MRCFLSKRALSCRKGARWWNPSLESILFIFTGKGFRGQREKVTVGLWHVVAWKLAEFNPFPPPLLGIKRPRDLVLSPNSEASWAASLLHSVNSNCIIFCWIQYYAESAEPYSWKSLLHTWYFFQLKRECLSKPFSGSKEHAVRLFAYRSPCCQKKPLWNKSFQKLARTIVGKESTIETKPKKLLVKASNCSEVN